MIRLPLLTVVYKKSYSGSYADDDETFENTFVKLIIVRVVATGEGRVVVVDVVVFSAVVVGVRVFKEGGEPFAEGPVLFGFWMWLVCAGCKESGRRTNLAQIGWS